MTTSSLSPDHTTTSESARWRLLLLGGPAYAVLLVVAAAVFAAPPSSDVPAALQPDWLLHHADVVTAQAYVRAVAALGFICLGVGVARSCHVHRLLTAGTMAAVGAAASGGFMLLAQAAALGSAQLERMGAAVDVRPLGGLQETALDVSSLPAVLLFAASGVLVLRAGFPRWLAAFCLVGVPLALLDAASYDGGPLAAVGLVGLVYFLAWSLVVGVVLFRRVDGVPTTRGPHTSG